jgi:hypothetical protein
LAGGLAAVEMRHQEGQSFVDQVEGQLLAIADCAVVVHRRREDNQLGVMALEAAISRSPG